VAVQDLYAVGSVCNSRDWRMLQKSGCLTGLLPLCGRFNCTGLEQDRGHGMGSLLRAKYRGTAMSKAAFHAERRPEQTDLLLR
jgi:hypothetical protein